MSAQTGQRGSLDTESDMLPQDPPPWIIRWTAWLLLGFLGFAFVLSIIMKLPETVRCPFVLVPASGADPVQAPRQGTITAVSANEGQTVKKGDELFVLRSDEIRGWGTQQSTLGQDLRSKEEGLKQFDAAYQAQLEIKKGEIEQAKSEVGFRENHSRTSRDLVNRMEKLAKQGGESEVEFIKLKLDLAGSEKDLSVAQRTLQQVNLDLHRIETEHARQRGEQVAEIENLKTRLVALKSDLENTTDNLLTVRSPYDGVVISLDQRTPGSFVQQGAVLCQLSQQEAEPRARLTVNEPGLPKLAVAQKVRYFFEAFPYQRYGAVNGKLNWVSPSAVTASDGPHFIALATVDNSGNAGHKTLHLRVGMRGEAHIVVGARSPIEYVLEPIHQLRESMSQ
jgi:multidrug efflux pump subunit AcrA (membrane-fusion protein)